ncbi:MAG: hypothetical protein NT076_02195 [Candidatus Pacearchaeota archaeon]|nr:hypothetical protein [Candidatus Pacearchaeota archaeon]
MKKSLVMLVLLLALLPLISAELKIEKEAVVDSFIVELNQPAIFNFKLTNLGNSDNFNIYSLVGVDIKPNETFNIKEGETKELQVSLWPSEALLDAPQTLNFAYKIKSQSGIQQDILTMRIVTLDQAVDINSYNIEFDSDSATVYVKNMIGYKFDEVKASFHSAFFDFEKTFSLDKYEKKEFPVVLNKEETRKLMAGSYTITSNVEIQGMSFKKENTFKFTEKSEITSQESTSGFIIRKTSVTKTNNGNLPVIVQVKLKKNIISRLLTSFNTQPSIVDRTGFTVYYLFQKELKPSEVYNVTVRTNFLYPLIVIIALIIIVYLVKMSSSSSLELNKRSAYVKTKGGEFALKITLQVKARKYVENINLVDRLPSISKLYEKFPGLPPDKIDLKNNRLEWNISNLQPGEQRIFSYIVYSKIAPLGKFELPQALAVYERAGKPTETLSNKVFFLNTPRAFVD